MLNLVLSDWTEIDAYIRKVMKHNFSYFWLYLGALIRQEISPCRVIPWSSSQFVFQFTQLKSAKKFPTHQLLNANYDFTTSSEKHLCRTKLKGLI